MWFSYICIFLGFNFFSIFSSGTAAGSSKCEDLGTFSNCSEANAGIVGRNACCDANGFNCNQARVVGQSCTKAPELNPECQKLVCTDPLTPDENDDDDTFPVYGIVLLAVFGGTAVIGGGYYLIRKYSVQRNSKGDGQNKPATGQTLIF